MFNLKQGIFPSCLTLPVFIATGLIYLVLARIMHSARNAQ